MSKILLTLSLLYTTILITPPTIHAINPWGNECVGDELGAAGQDVATIQGLECIVLNILNVAITLIGVGVLVMIVLGAYQLLTSGGDPKAVEAGKNTITYAILGLVLAISSWFIISLIANFTGTSSITQFSTQIGN